MTPGAGICVFCGSRKGNRPEFEAAAVAVGREIARRGLTLVYGGGRVGLMGLVADSALAEGGRVVGVIPTALASEEVAHSGCQELLIVDGMHARKAEMARRSSAFLTLPGGVGTYEEFFEIFSWATLGLHANPLGVLDVGGYFVPLRAMLEHAAAEGFTGREYLDLVFFSEEPGLLIDRLVRS